MDWGHVNTKFNLSKAKPVSFREMCPEIASSRYSTHAFHSYPAQLIPQIPYYFLRKMQRLGSHRNLVFDPFCGTGTVLVEAMQQGFDSIGVEINPIAALISKVKTTPIGQEELEKGLDRIKESYCHEKSTNEMPSWDNIHYWFENDSISELSKIRNGIDTIENPETRDFYQVTFSSIIKNVSKADPRIYVPVLPKEGYLKRKINIWNLFKERAHVNIKRMGAFIKQLRKNDASCKIANESILDFQVESGSINYTITSPPYISAQKYVRSTRLEAYWLGYDQDFQLKINKNTIGTEQVLSGWFSKFHKANINQLDEFIQKIYSKNKERAGIIAKYFIEMKEVIRKIYSATADYGVLVMIIGNNTVCGEEIKTNEFLSEICEENGFEIFDIMVDKIQSRGLMTKRNSTSNIINQEWVIAMRKM